MIQNQTIALLSRDWYLFTSLSFSAIIIVIYMGHKLDEKGQRFLQKFLGVCCILSLILIHPYLISVHQWHAQTSLPLHMCELSEIFAGIALIWPGKRIFEFLCYWGIPGGLHSILTPELLHQGEDNILVFHYYFQHTLIILAPLFLMIIRGNLLSKHSWLHILLLTQLALPIIGSINWLLGSNYMFLCNKPIAENPFVIGDWPWYIIGFEVAMLIHFYLVYFIARKIKIITSLNQ